MVNPVSNTKSLSLSPDLDAFFGLLTTLINGCSDEMLLGCCYYFEVLEVEAVASSSDGLAETCLPRTEATPHRYYQHSEEEAGANVCPQSGGAEH